MTAVIVTAAVAVVALIAYLVMRRRAASRRPPPSTGIVGGSRSIARRVRSLTAGASLAAIWSELEGVLIEADVGVATAAAVVAQTKAARPADGAAARRLLHAALVASLSPAKRSLRHDGRPSVYLIVGVNGVGKTTTIAKLAGRLQRLGRVPILAAADTFRAAAAEQLRLWGDRLGVDVVAGHPGSDPAAVAFDALAAARARKADVLLVDTAGRLHVHTNLMGELEKIAGVLRREAGDLHESLLVLDGTTGQNGIAQARGFATAAGITGVIVTKLDGTAKGGVVVPIESELGVPVKLVGVGEGLDDLLPFDRDEYVSRLLGTT